MGLKLSPVSPAGKWLGLVTAVWVQAISGNNYTFSNYSDALKTLMGLTQLQLNSLSVAKDVGKAFGIFAGLASDRLPTPVILLIGSVEGFIGYGVQWLVVSQRIQPLPYWAMSIFLCMGGNSTTWMNTAILVTCIRNFRKNRGPVSGILKGYVGLSTAIFTDVCSALFADDPAKFLMMLTVVPLVVCLAAMFFLREIPPSHTVAEENEETKFFGVINVIAVIIALYLLAFDVSGAHGRLFSQIFAAILLILLAAPLAIPIYLGMKNFIRHGAESEDVEQSVTEPLLVTAAEVEKKLEAAEAVEKRPPVVGEEAREALACKSISKKKLRTAVDVEDVRREVAIMSSLPDHGNVVKLRATYEDSEAVHLVMELCEGGELFDRIVARGHYSERAAAGVARTIAEVVRMCHQHGVMHRDLKPENFLFANKKENSALKAIDFGLSVFFKPGEKFSEIVGSPYYMAPEVLKRNYGPEVDIWSAGVILYILLCGVPPFWAETEQGVALAILRGVIDFKREPWPQISESAKNLVRQMLEPDPKKRLTAQQVLDHPWIQNAKKASNVPLGDVVRARLKQFSCMNRFKKRALRVIAEHLSVEEVEVIRDMFALMDTDNDGKVTFDELKTGLRKVGSQLAEPEMKLLMDVADVDGNGVLDYGEFVAVTIHLQRMENDEHFRRAFMFFDKDGSGYIEVDELREALSDESGEIDADVLNDIIREVDTDKDGQISYDEFVAMMKTGTDWRKASRQYSRERFKSLSLNLMKDGSLLLQDGFTGQSVVV